MKHEYLKGGKKEVGKGKEEKNKDQKIKNKLIPKPHKYIPNINHYNATLDQTHTEFLDMIPITILIPKLEPNGF